MMLIDKTSLPQHLYEAKQVRENEPKIAKLAGLSMYQLMESAGDALFHWVQSEYDNSQPLLILCGKGNNGGDGYVLARLAFEAEYSVHVMVTALESDIKGDALKALILLQDSYNASSHQTKIQLSFLQAFDEATGFYSEFTQALNAAIKPLVVDALFGIGFKGSLTDNAHALVKAINDSKLPVLSVDIPSGLSADTGRPQPIAIIATITISFIAMKKGLLTATAANYVGSLRLAELQVGHLFQKAVPSTTFVQNTALLPTLRVREPASHKGNIGLAACVGGNAGLPGAIRLCGEGALRSGASLVSIACHKDSAGLVFSERPEFMLLPNTPDHEKVTNVFKKAKVIILGPGLGDDAWAESWFHKAMSYNCPKVIDADGLRLLSKIPYTNQHWVLTPHPGEAASLLGCDIATVENDRFAAVKKIALQYGGICVLKGAGTLISDGDCVWVNTTGNAGMASGGMGDVLSGLIGALMMQMPSNIEATRLAIYIHGHAADILAEKEGMTGLLASDLLPVIRRLLNQPYLDNLVTKQQM